MSGIAISVLAIIALGTGMSRTHEGHSKGKHQQQAISQVTKSTEIPDSVAYEMFFMSLVPQIAGEKTAEEAAKAKLVSLGLSEADKNSINGIARQFANRRSQEIDSQVDVMREQSPDAEAPATLSKLESIQKQKEVVIEESRSSVSQQLSKEGADKIAQYVNEYVKPRITIIQPSQK
jgi:hypothetical protein